MLANTNNIVHLYYKVKIKLKMKESETRQSAFFLTIVKMLCFWFEYKNFTVQSSQMSKYFYLFLTLKKYIQLSLSFWNPRRRADIDAALSLGFGYLIIAFIAKK